MEAKDGKPLSAAVAAIKIGTDRVDKWWTVISRLVVVQLCCSLLMQLSYVAFPAYNFALALWCLVCCTPKWALKNPRLLPLHLLAVAASIVTDVIWTSLWVSGRVFYDQFCGQNGVSIVSCGGASDYYPGCQMNRFALFTLILNDLAKAATLVAMYRVHVHIGHHHHSHSHSHSHSSQDSSSSSNNVVAGNARVSTDVVHHTPAEPPTSQA